MANIIVEDGSIVLNVNSYISVNDAKTIASNLGLILPSDDNSISVLLLKAMAYIESRSYQGHIVNQSQSLKWPRNLVFVDGFEIPATVIPDNIKKAQVTAANIISQGTELFDTISGQFITREKVGPIETDYSDEFLATANGLTVFGSIDIYLQPYIVGSYGGYKLSSFGF